MISAMSPVAALQLGSRWQMNASTRHLCKDAGVDDRQRHLGDTSRPHVHYIAWVHWKDMLTVVRCPYESVLLLLSKGERE